MYVEYKKTVNNELIWVNGDYFKQNPYYRIEGNDEPQYEPIELHGHRDYSLFSTLCGVRDYTDKMIPVSDPKGIPDDCSAYVKSECEKWEGDGHSHSFLSLKELKDYQTKGIKIKYTGLISPEQLIDFDKGILPTSWCQGTNQPGWERREWEEENHSLVPLIEKMQKRAHELMQYDWQEYDIANDEKIRIVFFFDN